MKTLISTAVACAAALVLSSGASAAITTYTAVLSGAAEFPPNASPGTGFAQVDWDDVLNTMRVQASFQGLTGNTTACHIHAATALPGVGTAGVATTTPTFAGFPLGVTAGVYDRTLDLTLSSSFNAAYVTANGGTLTSAATALKAALDSGRAYFNVHSSTFGGGEIRGFLIAVPSPGAAGLCAMGGLVAMRRRR